MLLALRNIFILFAFFFSYPAFSDGSTSHLTHIPQIKTSKECFSGDFESHDSWAKERQGRIKNFDRQKFNTSYPESTFNQYKASLRCYIYTYKVDNLDIGGFLIAPKISDKPAPVIIFNRGGNGSYGHMSFAALYTHAFYLAQEGFVVIGTQYRGGMGLPDSIGGKDEFGGLDTRDVEALFSIIDKLSFADSQRIGMMGGSRGTINMFQAAKNTRRLKALVSFSGLYDMQLDFKFRPSMEDVYRKRIPQFDSNRTYAFDKRSVIKWADQLDLNAPILIMHGEYDDRTSAKGALKFALRLQELAHAYRLIIFEIDDHFLSLNREQANQEIIDWFKKYL